MQITVLKETEPDETRVALVPESVKRLVSMKATVAIESGAGRESGASDADYEAAGASVSKDRAALIKATDALTAVNRPSPETIAQLKRGAVVISFLRPLDEPLMLKPMIEQRVTGFAMELITRSTRAPAMDALSSMAT